MLPRRCWNELHPRQTASPVDSTTGFAVYAQGGHRLRPRAMALNLAATTTPPPAISTKAKAGKGIRTLDIQLGKRGSWAVLLQESALRCFDRG